MDRESFCRSARRPVRVLFSTAGSGAANVRDRGGILQGTDNFVIYLHADAISRGPKHNAARPFSRVDRNPGDPMYVRAAVNNEYAVRAALPVYFKSRAF